MKQFLLAAAPGLLLLSCGDRVEQYVLPDQVADFAALYNGNCAGCHGPDGRSGAARPLNDTAFLAVIGKQSFRKAIAKGVPGTAMPAFSKAAGGTLTDQQINVLSDQIMQRWSRPQDFLSVVLPPYRANLGDPAAGKAAFGKYCSNCHGEAGTSKAGSVVDPAFLALVSDQSLRTTVIVGRSDLGTPDWRSYSPGHPMSNEEISDVVAWLSAQRMTPVKLTLGGKLP